jgi:PAS domain S-box-containing protein
MSSVQANPYEFQKRQIDLIVRTTPYAMVGHLVNTAVIAAALAGSVQPVPLIIWSAYSCCVALLLLFRHVRNRGRLAHSFHRAAKKVVIYAFLLALPWSSLGILYLGSLSQGQELVLSAIPRAAFLYMSVILIPTAFKCFVFSQEGYLLLGTLALSYWGCLAAFIAKTSRDVRERQEAEMTLAERDAHLALAAKAGLVGSYSYDPNCDGVQISEGYAAIHGLPEGTKESTRIAWWSRMLPEDRERINSHRRQAFSERRREYDVEYRIVRAGEIRWIEARGFISYSRDGHPQRVIGVNIDITERKRAEERQRALVAELKQSNDRLQLALDCAELGTWSLHLNTGRFENDVRDRRIHGHGQEAPPKTLAEMRSQVHPDDLSKLDAAFGELKHPGGSCRTEYRLSACTDEERAGRVRWVTIEGTVLRGANGRPEQLLGVTRDITERKKAEVALRESEARLAGQRKALELALNGTPLESSLSVLVRTATDQLGEGVRAAFYLANPAGNMLHHVVGMPAAYAEAVDGFEIGPAFWRAGWRRTRGCRSLLQMCPRSRDGGRGSGWPKRSIFVAAGASRYVPRRAGSSARWRSIGGARAKRPRESWSLPRC